MNRIVRVTTAVALLTLAACVGDTPQVPEKSCENCGTVCVDLRTDVNHCGKCDTKCGAGEICTASKCVLNCPTGFLACGGKCIDPNTNAASCGAKGACTGTDATAADYAGATCGAIESCVAGKCSGRCPAGRLLCGDGCIDPLTDHGFCGAKDDCAAANAGTACAADQFCIAGKCSCPTGQIVCGGKCVDPKSNGDYCGAKGDCEGTNAGKECKAGEGCSNGVCGACNANQVLCGTSCIDPKNDREYCGATGDCVGTNAGAKCLSVEACDTGVCKLTCASGQIKCGSKCVDPSTDLGFCGAKDDCAGVNAGTPCTTDQYCNAGTCAAKVACAAGQLQCGSTCVAPASDPAYCGAKGTCTGTDPAAADYAGATCAAGEFCSAGKCLPLDACPAGQIKCDGKCIDPETDDLYCGAKGKCTDSASDAGVSPDTKGQACTGMNRCKTGTCQPIRAASCEELALAATGAAQDYQAKECAFGANTNWANWYQAQAPCEAYCKARGAPAARIEGYGTKSCGSGTCDYISNFETCAIGSIPNGGGCSHCSVGFRCVCRYTADNLYTLYIDNDGAKPYQAYCKDMGTATPKTYLVLANTGGDNNFAQFTAGGARPGTNIRTTFTRLRFDPKAMTVDVTDLFFATSTGSVTYNGVTTTTMNYGVAADCITGGSTAGIANVNMVGTPFRVTGTWQIHGFTPGGAATSKTDGQVWTITGGGFCGSHEPVGNVLHLEYIAPKAANVYVATETNAVQHLALGEDLQFTEGAKVATGNGEVVSLRLNASGKDLYAGGATALRAWAVGTDGSLTTPGTTLTLARGAPDFALTPFAADPNHAYALFGGGGATEAQLVTVNGTALVAGGVTGLGAYWTGVPYVHPDGLCLYSQHISPARIHWATINRTTGALTTVGGIDAPLVEPRRTTVMHPARNYLYGVTGNALIHMQVAAGACTLSNLQSVAAGWGPRQLAVHPSGLWLYASGPGSIHRYSIAAGVPSADTAFTADASVERLVIPSAGVLLSVSPAEGKVTAWKIDPTNGALTKGGTATVTAPAALEAFTK